MLALKRTQHLYTNQDHAKPRSMHRRVIASLNIINCTSTQSQKNARSNGKRRVFQLIRHGITINASWMGHECVQ
jgi:hypothetical protein